MRDPAEVNRPPISPQVTRSPLGPVTATAWSVASKASMPIVTVEKELAPGTASPEPTVGLSGTVGGLSGATSESTALHVPDTIDAAKLSCWAASDEVACRMAVNPMLTVTINDSAIRLHCKRDPTTVPTPSSSSNPTSFVYANHLNGATTTRHKLLPVATK